MDFKRGMMTITTNLALDDQNKENDLVKFKSMLGNNFDKKSLFLQNNHFELEKISSLNFISNVKNPRNKFLGEFGVFEHAPEFFFLSHELKQGVYEKNNSGHINVNLIGQLQAIDNSKLLSTPLINMIPDMFDITLKKLANFQENSNLEDKGIKWNQ